MKLAALAAAAMLVAPPAAAQIFSGDSSFGPDTVTIDAAQGLEFLDLTVTQGEDYAVVENALGPGGAYEGWRFATREELRRLTNNWGFSPEVPADFQGTLIADTPADQLQGLVDLVGVTAPGIQTRRSSGFHATSQSEGSAGMLLSFGLADTDSLTVRDRVETAQQSPAPSQALGMWLVRSTVRPTIQGRLTNGGVAISGTYDLRLQLLRDGVPSGAPKTLGAVVVDEGLFAARLPFDFGAGALERLEIEITVLDPRLGPVTLSPPLPVAPAPKAVAAERASVADTAAIASTAETAAFAAEAGAVDGVAMPVDSGPVALRVIRGIVNADGSVNSGSGFISERFAAGQYRIFFTEPFSTLPVITANGFTAGEAIISFNLIGLSSVELFIIDTDGLLQDRAFTFIALIDR